MNTVYHRPVLVREVLEYLITSGEGVYVDATTGGGGHTEAIAGTLSKKGRIICFDRDADAIGEAKERLKNLKQNMVFVHDAFGAMSEKLSDLGIENVDGVLFDLGVSSYQLDTVNRGFTFQYEAPLDMRMDARTQITGYTIVNEYPERKLADIFYYFGEERNARRIARRIAEDRETNAIRSSGDLAAIIKTVVGDRHLTKSMARIFQALRIEVNAELDQLSRALAQIPSFLRKGGRLVVISYHSLEDRIVKNFIKEQSTKKIRSEDPFARSDKEIEPRFRILTKKPVYPAADELRENPRSRSAKLRAAERL